MLLGSGTAHVAAPVLDTTTDRISEARGDQAFLNVLYCEATMPRHKENCESGNRIACEYYTAYVRECRNQKRGLTGLTSLGAPFRTPTEMTIKSSPVGGVSADKIKLSPEGK